MQRVVGLGGETSDERAEEGGRATQERSEREAA
jgi:hypothetical protein